MIIVKLAGGLGNQLFQYSFGQYIQNKYKLKVIYDISFYESKKRLSHEKLTIRNFPEIKLNTIKYAGLMLNIKIFKKSLNSIIVTENNLNNVKNYDNKIYIGNWQTYKFSLEIKNILMRELNFESKELTNYINILNIVNYKTTATIHVRGTDILSGGYGGKFKPLNENYYIKALNYFSNIERIVIVTDDPEYAKSLNFKSYPLQIISTEDVLVDFMVLRNAKNLICANSTFSWWAGFLGNSENIIFPNDLNFTKIPDFIPKNWIII